MRVVVEQFEVRVVEVEERLLLRVEAQGRKRPRRALELGPGLLQMVEVQVGVAQRVDELTRLAPRDLCHHEREQSVGGDVERHAEKYVGAALVELAGGVAGG